MASFEEDTPDRRAFELKRVLEVSDLAPFKSAIN